MSPLSFPPHAVQRRLRQRRWARESVHPCSNSRQMTRIPSLLHFAQHSVSAARGPSKLIHREGANRLTKVMSTESVPPVTPHCDTAYIASAAVNALSTFHDCVIALRVSDRWPVERPHGCGAALFRFRASSGEGARRNRRAFRGCSFLGMVCVQ